MTSRPPARYASSRSARRVERERRMRRHLLIAAAAVAALSLSAAAAWTVWDRLESRVPGLEPAVAGRGEHATTTPPAEAPDPTVLEPSVSPTLTTEATSPLGPPAPSGPATVTVAAVGDILFDRRVEAFIRTHGGAAPLEAVAPRLASADVTFGNLESVLGTTGKPVAGKEYTFRGPLSAMEGLKAAGFDALSLANNHALDYGSEPLKETVSALDKAGIAHSGAGSSIDEAWRPATVTRPRAKVAFLAYTHVLPPGFLAGENRWGVAFGRSDPARVVAAIKSAKKTHDYVVVSFHWGVELKDDANAAQVEWGHRAIDAGADMVIGHHPHVIQGVEFYKGRLIAYSLGDFVWDHSRPKSGESFILEAKMGPHGTSDVRAFPVYMQQSTGKPDYAEPSMADKILTRLQKISSRHGTDVTIEGQTARLTP